MSINQLDKKLFEEPISCTCEVMISNNPLKLCDSPTIAAYPAMGGGWMSLCFRHAQKHLPEGAFHTDQLIDAGAKWK